MIFAEHMGMCFGVKGALKVTEDELARGNGNGGIYTLGELVHNPHVVNYLKDKGVKVAKSLDEIEKGTVIIRAHGVPERVKEEARQKGLNCVDGTCVLVSRLQDAAKSLEVKGYQVVIYGEKDHAEIIGVAGNLKNPLIINSLEEAKAIGEYEKIGLVAQTTKMPEKYDAIEGELRDHCRHIEVKDTICNATQNRQYYARKAANDADVVVVVGDLASSNTKNLAEICRKTKETFLVGCAAELKPEYFKGKKRAGLTAGASTPDWIIDDVVKALRKM